MTCFVWTMTRIMELSSHPNWNGRVLQLRSFYYLLLNFLLNKKCIYILFHEFDNFVSSWFMDSITLLVHGSWIQYFCWFMVHGFENFDGSVPNIWNYINFSASTRYIIKFIYRINTLFGLLEDCKNNWFIYGWTMYFMHLVMLFRWTTMIFVLLIKGRNSILPGLRARAIGSSFYSNLLWVTKQN